MTLLFALWLFTFLDGNAQHIATAKQLLNEVASDYFEQLNCSRNAADELPELRFYYEGPEVINIADDHVKVMFVLGYLYVLSKLRLPSLPNEVSIFPRG